MVVNEEWLAGNDEYIERKVLKEMKLKRKREEKNHLQQDTESSRKNEDKGKEKVINVEEDAERKRKVKVKGKEKLVDSEEGSEKNKRINKQKHNSVLKGRATVRQLFEAMRGLSPERKKVIREMGFGDLIEFPIFEIPTKLAFYVVDILNTTNMTLECPMGDIVITPKTVKQVLTLPMGRRRLEREGHREYNDPFLLQWKEPFRNVNKLTIKALLDITYLHYTKFDILKVKRRLSAFKSWNTSLLKKREIVELQNHYIGIGEIQDDVEEGEEPNQNEQRMNDISKDLDMPEYLSSSSSESDDDNDDGSQLADENEERTSKNDVADYNKEEGMANKKATNQKRNEEIDPFDDPKFGEYYIQNEHLFVPTQTSAEKKNDQTYGVNWDSFLENEEEIIRKGREFSAETRKKAQQQE
ncbi:hypothetical protein Tco_0484601 [Tanacetum coccineum]